MGTVIERSYRDNVSIGLIGFHGGISIGKENVEGQIRHFVTWTGPTTVVVSLDGCRAFSGALGVTGTYAVCSKCMDGIE